MAAFRRPADIEDSEHRTPIGTRLFALLFFVVIVDRAGATAHQTAGNCSACRSNSDACRFAAQASQR